MNETAPASTPGALRPPEAGRRVLVLGGARSGKSEFAESLVAADPAVTYVATGTGGAGDPEWECRIEAHQSRRPPTWGTLETSDLAAALRDARGALVVDSLTAWLAGVMDRVGAWDAHAAATEAQAAASEAVSDSVERFVQAWHATTARVVAVSDEVGLGVVPATPAGRLFRDELGVLNRRVAAAADAVWLVVAGIPVRLR